MNSEKVGQYFFIIAAVVSILDGAFTLNQDTLALKFVVLILSGIFVGIFKQFHQKEFIIAGLSVVLTGFVLVQLLKDFFFLNGLGIMLLNFIVFLSSAVIVVGIREVGGSITVPTMFAKQQEEDETKQLEQLKKLTPKQLRHLSFQRTWGTVILVAVALTFIILLAETFFDTSRFSDIIFFADIVITVLFIVDLIILYEQSKGFRDFFTNNIFDIIASIPTVGALRGLKIIRAVRIVKVLRSTSKTGKLVKLYKTSKFFSEESYFNVVEKDKYKSKVIKKAKKTVAKKNASAKKKSAKKAKAKVAKKVAKKATRKVAKRATRKTSAKKKTASKKRSGRKR